MSLLSLIDSTVILSHRLLGAEAIRATVLARRLKEVRDIDDGPGSRYRWEGVLDVGAGRPLVVDVPLLAMRELLAERHGLAYIHGQQLVRFRAEADLRRSQLLSHPWGGPEVVPIIDAEHARDGGGRACLAMVLAYHGVKVSIEELHHAVRVADEGVDAQQLLAAAEARGFTATAMHVPPAGWRFLPRPSIVHLRSNYFVVLERACRDAVDVIGAVEGRLTLSPREFLADTTGTALVFRPNGSASTPTGPFR